ncbi:tRNA synthetases class I, catalytic domain-containing protein [Zopfochytrium polystomum]|nr:tRNA synthetases class I, catalytic domain-containing protein [Zopfochytrium polystomum]
MNPLSLRVAQKAATPAYAVVAVAHRLKLPVQFASLDAGKSAELTVPASSTASEFSLSSTYPVLRLLSKYTPEYAAALGTADPVKASQIDYWLDFCVDSLAPTAAFKPLSAAFSKLDSHLKLRSFLVGYHLTVADIACWGALRSSPIFNKQLRAGSDIGTYLQRWFSHVESLDFVNQALSDIEKAVNDSNKAKKDQGSFDIGLKDAQPGKVVTRFPPEPSGYLHIGHAKAALLNDYFARHYEGKLLLRFDDTNPSKEKMEFEESIKEDLSLLGIKPDALSYTSDYFKQLHDIATDMIKKGLAYADDADMETMREERLEMKDSKCRNLPVEESLRRFAEMTKGSEEGLRNCLRAKINMQDKNGALRDPVIYRCNLTPHHRTGTTWKVYPTYDLACPVVDSIEGVTHALRSNEYRDRNVQYEWFLKALNLRWVHMWDFSRINFVYTLLSKRKLTWFVDTGVVSGWDDPRVPTVRGIRRRGMTIQALREYILMQGASQKLLELEWDKIWAKNKSVIDPIAPRHTGIVRDKITKVRVVDRDSFKPYAKETLKHKKNPDVGMKTTVYSSELYIEFADAKDLSAGEEVTFMDWGNVIIEKIQWTEDKSFIGIIDISLNLDGDFKKTKKKLTWLSRAIPEGRPELAPVKLLLLDYDFLINKKKLEEGDELKDFLTPVSEFKTEAWGDWNLRLCKKGDIIQLERKGYYIIDKPFASEAEPIHLILIPDGSAASTSLKGTPGETASAAGSKDASKKQSDGKGTSSPSNVKPNTAKKAAESAAKAKSAEKPATPKAEAPTPNTSAAKPVSDVDASNVNMYKVTPVYGNGPELSGKVGSMYVAKPFY